MKSSDSKQSAKSRTKKSKLVDQQTLIDDLVGFADSNGGDGASNTVRKAVLAHLKQVNADARSQAEKLLMEDGNGTLCARRISQTQDTILSALYKFTTTRVFLSNNPSEAERMAVTAVGGYGRGTLAPGSDIDLLFVLPYKQTPWGESVAEYILYMLWDLGLKVGHATRTIDECIRLSKEDWTICTSILEVRHLAGEKKLTDELIKRFIKEVMTGTAPEFIAAKLEERNERHTKSGQSRYLVEPNIKDGKGGLRDLHTLFWIGKYLYRFATRRQLVEAKVFDEKEYIKFKAAQDFLWTVRCHLHFMTGKAEERLTFDYQAGMAERLGYTDHPGASAVERFMKHYFLNAKTVGDLTLIFCAALEEQQAKSTQGISGIVRSIRTRKKAIAGTKDFVRQTNRINAVDDTVFKTDPVNLLRIFVLADKNDLDFHPDVLRLITKSLKLIKKPLKNDPAANKLFIDVLTSPRNPETMLRKMNETGVLGRFVPEFGKVVAMMQFNMYHHYTVDEHSLRSIGILSEIEHGELGDQHPLANEIMPMIKDRVVLYVALFLHDIAKGRPEDHSIVGAKIAEKLCPRFGLSEEQTKLVSWLVLEHLTMSNTAQSRDLSDRKTITDFADVMQSLERMRYLLILTVCDTKAVGPGVWNGWKGQLLRTLYYETEPMLTGGFSQVPQRDRVAQIKEKLREAFADFPEKEANRLVELNYSAYTLTVDIDTQIRHLKFISQVDAEKRSLATDVDTRSFEAITEITVLAPDHPRLLSIIAGACSMAGANIVDAKIYTTRDGRALDAIFINREFANDQDEYRRAQRIGQLIEDVLSGKTYRPEVLAKQKKPKRSTRAFSVSPLVHINNELSHKFSVIEVEGLDRAGLLSKLTRAIADLSLDIASAHIATFGEKVVDSFYVTDLVGHKIQSPQRMSAIRKKLLSVLEPEAEQKGKAA